MEFNMTDIVKELETRVVEITFDKKDGTERVMNATLQEAVVPETKGGNSKNTDKNVDKQGWRTIVVENIKKVA
jgi:cytochrome oxidase Cu insertion factor (SCO1/SenC/PrrC family)